MKIKILSIIPICLCAVFAGNEIHTLDPAQIITSSFSTAHSAVQPLAGDSLSSGESTSWPGFLYSVYIPILAENRDAVSPYVKVLNPPVAFTIRDSLPDIILVASDNSPIDASSAVLIVDEDTVNLTADWSGDTVQYSFSSALSQGLHEVTFAVQDTAGNWGIKTWSFSIDENADTTAVGYEKITETTYPIQGTVGANDSVFIFVNGDPKYACQADGNGSYVAGFLNVPQGGVEIAIISMDTAGNITSRDTTLLLVDSELPTAEELDDAKGRITDSLFLTGIPVLIFRYADTVSGLDTSSLWMVFNGDTAEFSSVETQNFSSAFKLKAMLAQKIGNVEAVYQAPVLKNHSTVTIIAGIRDNNGNRLKDSLTFTVEKSDTTPPVISFIDDRNKSVTNGDAVTLSFSGQEENANLYRLSLRLFRAGDSVEDTTRYYTQICTTVSEDTLEVSVDTDHDSAGFSYIAEAMDDYGNLVIAAPGGVTMAYDNYRDGSARFTPESWQMFSVPFGESNTQDSIEAKFGAYDPAKWRWARYHDEEFVEFGDDDDFDSIAPGLAFWIHHRFLSPWEIRTGSAKTASTADTFSMELEPGWNQIGNPFLFPVKWEQVRFSVADSSVSYLYAYDSSTGDYFTLDPADTAVTMLPWSGYWIQNKTLDTVTMYIDPSFQCTTGQIIKTRRESGWKSCISFTGKTGKTRGMFGEKLNGSAGLDRFDAYLPPSPSAGIRMMFIGGKDKRLSVSYSNLDGEKQGEAYPFRFENISKAESLLVDAEPNRYPCLYIWDKQQCKEYNVYDSSDCYVAVSGKEKAQDFELWAGTGDFIAKKLEEVRAKLPMVWAVSSYPNPFNPVACIRYDIPAGPAERDISIKIYRPNGRLVKTLVNGPAFPGRHRVFWKGRDANNKHVASGVYLLRVHCKGLENKVLTRKLVLLK